VAKLEKNKRIVGEARQEIAADLVERYERGATLRELADATGRSYGFVHRVLSQSGLVLRARGGAMRAKKGRAAS
jgi:predicted transcriptional regulator